MLKQPFFRINPSYILNRFMRILSCIQDRIRMNLFSM